MFGHASYLVSWISCKDDFICVYVFNLLMLFSLNIHIAEIAWLMNIVRSLFLFSTKKKYCHSF